MRQLIKPFDAAWFYVERPDAPVHFGPLVILSQPPRSGRGFVRDFVERWRAQRRFAPPFNYRLAGGLLPVWEALPDHRIDLDYHLRHSALPAPGGERELGVLVSRLHSHRLDRSRPLWECHVIEGLHDDRFAIYMKLHHGQLDGVGAARLMARVFSPDAEARELLPPWTVGMQSKRRPAGAPRSATTRTPRPGIAETLGAMPEVARTLGGLVRDVRSGAHPQVAAPFQAPETMLNVRIGRQRRFATQAYALKRFRDVAHRTETTINDVFLAISGAALRRYLREYGTVPERPLVGQLPVNLRPDGDAQLGNRLAFIYAHLPTHLDDPLQRLRAAHASVAAGKARHRSLPAAGVDPYTMLLLGPTMGQLMLGLGGLMRPAANLVISNVPGPRERLYFNGARVEQIYGPSVLFHGQALNITMSSYCDEANVGFTGCRDSLPSMQRLAVYTGEALDELESIVKPRRRRRPG